MNIAALFIRRPVMTTLVMLAIVLFGIMAYRQLAVSDLPNVDFPTINVNASLPGASPETMASAVARQLDPRQRPTRGVGIDEVASAIRANNVNLPAGVLTGPYTNYTVQANGQLFKAADYAKVIVAYRNGHPVRLGDLGKVMDDVENNHTMAWFKGKPGSILPLRKQPATTAVEVSDPLPPS